jgi:Rhodanese-like domain
MSFESVINMKTAKARTASDHGGSMKTLLVITTLLAVSLWIAPSAAQQQPRYPVDPQTNWAVGAKRTPAEELKKELDAGNKMLIIDVRAPEQFQRETIPGAINIPFQELEGHLKKMSKDTFIVFT